MSRGWCQALSILMVWQKIKLHGTQTRNRWEFWQKGLEEDKITWYSNAIPTSFQIWEAEKITGFSNMEQICSNACAVWESGRNYRVLKHHAVLLSAPNRFGSRRNCMALKHDRIACYTKVWFGSIRNCMVLNIPCATIAVSRALKAEEITGLSNGKYCGFKILVGL